MIIVILILAPIAFSIGFYIGKNRPIKTKKAARQHAEIIKLRQEFENFLNYDGSEQ